MSEDGLCPIVLDKLSTIGCFWQLYSIISPDIIAAQFLCHFYTTFIIILLRC